MPTESISLSSLHFIVLSVRRQRGRGVVAFRLRDEREDLRGLAATIWKRTVGWVSAGAGGRSGPCSSYEGREQFLDRYMHIK